MRKYISNFIKELLYRLSLPTVYTPIVTFFVTIGVVSGGLNLGDGAISDIVEIILVVVGAIANILGAANNPTNKKGF